ncbi:flagellar biosynthesis protein FlhF [Alkaliphilus hydrothermalis]|uniref:Flagellar biosynthesis protein FlhF n=1 Tax=Alkaliphilus hydrothermalis TaxID=1482730 RepID=A0ABS2NL97_9FIRM|nr:flagellar biosynthesis protein FlhF [Alkaliphilus hydrothermalis]MBM7613677.1 flagellar biosynthesis protein FlhF [Alkaliphilus hydrothermalis]
MKVKKVFGANNHEAMMKVRAELGPDAVILHQRRVKQKGLFGYFKKPVIEIVAALEDTRTKTLQPVIKSVANPAVKATTASASEDALKAIMEKAQERKQQEFKPLAMESQVKPASRNNDPGLIREIAEIKSMLSTVVKKVNAKNLPNSIKECQNKEVERLYNLLKEQEIEEEILDKIIEELDNHLNPETTKGEIEDQFKKVINRCVTDSCDELKSKVLFFVGPTGVGKTTTIAKLAAQYALNEGKKVGFISADTYRIAAVEQLKVYSEILNIPIEVIYGANEIHRAIDKLNHKDIVMVDTAGRSHKNKQQIMELQALLDQVDEKEIFLVVSCTAKNNDIREILDTYQFINHYKIILTKIDEATTYGTIINTALRTQKPISYLTTGQSVPDDIEVMNADKVVSLLMKEA